MRVGKTEECIQEIISKLLLISSSILLPNFNSPSPPKHPVSMSAGISRNLRVILLVLITVSDFGSGQDLLNPYSCMNTGDYIANSTYNANLNAALSALSSNMTQYGFCNASVGQGEDRANAVALCRADVLHDPCRRCVEKAAGELVRLCPNKKQAVKWYDLCMLHYSNLPINGFQTDGADTTLGNDDDMTDAVQFQQDRTVLLDVLRAKAVNGSSLLKVGAGRRNTSGSEMIHALLQCIPNLSQEECRNCLFKASQGLPTASSWGKKLISSCNLRYDVDLFYNETRLRELDVLVPEMPNSWLGKKDDHNTTKIVIIIVIPIAVCLILVAIFLRKRMKKMVREISEFGELAAEELGTVESMNFDFGEISKATNGFANVNKLGQGAFGVVYKGILSNGEEIAVKRLLSDPEQGDNEFKNEVLLLARLQHRNLVRLLGFSVERRERLLIYEFVPNASLDKFIFDPIKSSQLDWQTRCKIIRGIAKGLVYLHEDSQLKIIHRDLKPSNILLDGGMNPKIADFGMARLFGQLNETQGTRVAGTYGYIPPEHALDGQFSVKLDVFSFGVLVLEIISGQKTVTNDGENVKDILTIAWRNWREGTVGNVIDPVFRTGRDSIHDMLRCIHIGLLCVQENTDDRPSMSAVVSMLSSPTITLPVASQPAFMASSRFGPSSIPEYSCDESSSRVKTDLSENEMSVTELHPR